MEQKPTMPRRERRKTTVIIAAIGGLACLLGLIGLGFLAAAYATSGSTQEQLEATAYAKLTATAARWTATPTATPTNTPTPTATATPTKTATGRMQNLGGGIKNLPRIARISTKTRGKLVTIRVIRGEKAHDYPCPPN